MKAPANYPLLLEIAATEPDRAMASSIVITMFERLPVHVHPLWLEALQPNERAYATRRSQEWAILHNAASLTAADIRTQQANWTNWLLIRLATTLPQPARAVLATEGRTKRIRRLATQQGRIDS